jgi:PAS domain S-box-containing protein
LIWTATLDKKCDFFNKVWLDFTGKTLEEEIGEGWVEGVHPEDRERCFDIYSQSFDKHEPFSMVYRLRRHDGEYRWLQDSGTPRYNLQGDFTGYIGHCLDITDLIEAKNELDRREKQYRFITERSNDLIFVYRLKPEPGFEYVSPSSETITGYTPTDHYNDPMLGMKMVHPDDMHLLSELQTGKINTDIFRIRWIKKDGTIIWTESQNIPIYDNNGELTGIQGKATDITERVTNEQILKTQLRLNDFAHTHSKLELLQFLVDELERLTGSRIGFCHSVNPDQKTLDLQCWSTNMKSLVGGPVPSGTHFDINRAGIWHDCMEEKKTVIHNDYINHPSLRRMPEGHDIVTRQLAAPVIRNERILAIVGIGNKPTLYDKWDVEIVTKLADLVWDIYEVKRIEEDLLKLSQAILQSPVMTIITDIQSNIEYINPAVEKMSGYSLEELKGKNPRIFGATETDNDSEAELYRTLTKGDEWTGEFLNKNKDGKLYWVSASISPVLNNEGKATHFIAVEEDITGRKQSEKTILELNAGLEQKIEQRTAELRLVNTSLEREIEQHRQTEAALIESREQLNLAIKGSNDAPWDWNLVTDYLYYSDKWWQQLGYEHNEIPSDSNLWREMTHPDDIGFTHDILENALESDQDSYEAEFRLRHKLGHYVPVLSRGYISRDANGKAIRVTGTNQDLTERKKAEDILKWNKTLMELMANSSPFGFLVVDNRTDDIMYINHRFCEIWEIEQIEDRIQRGEMKNNDIIPYCLPVLADIPAFAESCKPLQDEANRIELMDVIAFTENRSIQRFSTQIRGKDDEYYGHFYIFEDITARTLVANELKQSKNEAEKANQAKSEFLSRISHELRTPLNSILGFAQLLDMDDLKKGQKRGVGHILKGGRHLLEMINEVLDISKIEAGQLSLSIGSVNVMQLIEGMMDVVSPIAADYKITMEYDNVQNEKFFVRADEQRLNQIMLNLLNNAIKYNFPGGSVVIRNSIVISQDTLATEFVRISVTDSGKGISGEDISKLYVPFERIGAESSNIEGTGLGLAVVKKLMDAMNGNVGVDSIPGTGSTFWIELPRSTNASVKVAAATEESTSNNLSGRQIGTILYIEDNVPNAELVQMILDTCHKGVRLITSSTGTQAVALAKENLPEIILLDLNLPDISGREVLKNLKNDSETKEIPVIIVSADAMPHQLHALMNEGASEYLTKPINVEKFNRLINDNIVNKSTG